VGSGTLAASSLIGALASESAEAKGGAGRKGAASRLNGARRTGERGPVDSKAGGSLGGIAEQEHGYFVIIRNDQIVFERYGEKFKRRRRTGKPASLAKALVGERR